MGNHTECSGIKPLRDALNELGPGKRIARQAWNNAVWLRKQFNSPYARTEIELVGDIQGQEYPLRWVGLTTEDIQAGDWFTATYEK